MSAGHTNAVPAGGGGLKVIASGTIDASDGATVQLPSPAVIVFVQNTANNTAVSAALANGIRAGGLYLSPTLSSDGRQLTISRSAGQPTNMQYLALG